MQNIAIKISKKRKDTSHIILIIPAVCCDWHMWAPYLLSSNSIRRIHANSCMSAKGNINNSAQIHHPPPNCLHAILKDGWMKRVKSTTWKKNKNGGVLTFSLRGLMGRLRYGYILLYCFQSETLHLRPVTIWFDLVAGNCPCFISRAGTQVPSITVLGLTRAAADCSRCGSSM